MNDKYIITGIKKIDSAMPLVFAYHTPCVYRTRNNSHAGFKRKGITMNIGVLGNSTKNVDNRGDSFAAGQCGIGAGCSGGGGQCGIGAGCGGGGGQCGIGAGCSGGGGQCGIGAGCSGS